MNRFCPTAWGTASSRTQAPYVIQIHVGLLGMFGSFLHTLLHKMPSPNQPLSSNVKNANRLLNKQSPTVFLSEISRSTSKQILHGISTPARRQRHGSPRCSTSAPHDSYTQHDDVPPTHDGRRSLPAYRRSSGLPWKGCRSVDPIYKI